MAGKKWQGKSWHMAMGAVSMTAAAATMMGIEKEEERKRKSGTVVVVVVWGKGAQWVAQ